MTVRIEAMPTTRENVAVMLRTMATAAVMRSAVVGVPLVANLKPGYTPRVSARHIAASTAVERIAESSKLQPGIDDARNSSRGPGRRHAGQRTS